MQSIPSPRPLPATLAGMTDQAFLTFLFRHGTASRAEIARATGISKPTISESANRLLAVGVITEAGETSPATRGRKALLYRANPDYGHTSAIVLERRNIRISTMDFCGQLISERFSTADLSFPAAIDWARESLAESATCLSTPRRAVAISVAAPVHPRTLAIHPVSGSPFSGSIPNISDSLGISTLPQVRVDNDVNWAAMAETEASRQLDEDATDTFLYIYLGPGIGAALVSEGQVIRGANGATGEFSYLPTPGGSTLHSWLAATSFGSKDHASIDVQSALQAFADPSHEEADQARELLAETVLTVSILFDPGTVIIGGPLAAAESLYQQIKNALEQRSLAPLQVRRGTPSNKAVLRGLTSYAMRDAQLNALQVAAGS
ncbi:ROK family protein [Corynebacterium sp. A21]|uniref:ROK family protein n=1 Tax=Corynebacterium sp. A21 TaxID=3457318 RepID=UPI003FD54602